MKTFRLIFILINLRLIFGDDDTDLTITQRKEKLKACKILAETRIVQDKVKN